ncbi:MULTISPECIES: nicotinate (nicotinamide) nucleotide adenylyltransferase [Leptospira]|uniref:Probable nicotinate-nucleotide adenylyltransferase n=1 Tax=Leptospira kirschneri str. 200802841 TaxID=1193047 RepID=A0A828XXR8_9LEPT|nr:MULTISPECIES: nicotinate (nicotinamide) nucleotide adenylyltransferase [Leptospira]EJO69211.1 nicotinate-nucleotide adenylyltransferase [Leptospira kirschneri serovar Grippotyphosa str. RM52]EKO49544.1 nicotinate-nucleotide adenylyltransferase [Leptospira kirschneri str. 200802841]EKP06714.1 nicotinate-nucleotide adenylyltransferase [Leptospira kirschneri str. 2008720114]EKQ85900.1 nicotinate-nucleotide adenylyltransferase [Leptospira kirschneri serovar Grippotyphosa str. Moskva]EKR09154.1 
MDSSILTGIFGGSFDPPHEGHSEILKSFFGEVPDCKEVFVIPNRQNPLKEEKISLPENILEMLNLFVSDFSQSIRILDLELNRGGGPSYTIQTIQELKTIYPNRKFVLLIGEDNYANFHKWKDWKKILTEVEKIFVFRRFSKEVPLNSHLNSLIQFQFLKNPLIPVTSTDLRKSFFQFKIPNLISKKVLDYILKNKLYSK